MRITPLIRDGRLRVLFAALFLAPALAAQSGLSAPPDFSQDSIARAAAQLSLAWNAWGDGDAGLEQRVYQLPMMEARDLLQRSLGRYLDVIEARRAYASAVASYIGQYQVQPRSGKPVVTIGEAYRNQIELLGLNLTLLQQRLDALQSSNDWVAIRRAVQPPRTDILALQSARRQDIPVDLSLGSPDHPSEPQTVPPLVYRDSEAKLAGAMEQLWTRYYQALADAVEQKPSGSAPLAAVRGAAAEAPPPPSGSAASPLAGVWTYVEGSQQFNGLGEPRDALLELWVENGMLAGRYRVELRDFQGTRKIDIRLHGPLEAANNQPVLDFESKDPAGTGKIVLEYNPLRKELMFVRPAAQTVLPRGREILHPR